MSQVLSPPLPQTSSISWTLTQDRVRWQYVCYVSLLLVLLALAFARFRFRDMPLERDEGEYAYMGQLMLHGVPPYQTAANMKLPGTYAAYATIMAFFGETAAGIHIGMILVTTAAGFLVFLLGQYLYGPLTGAIAGSTYVFLASRPGVLGIDGHATHFVVLMALAGILLLLYAIDRGRTALFFASGLCLGLAFLMKQPGIVFALLAGVYWLYREWKHPLNWRRLSIRGGALLVGTLLPYFLTCLFLVREGVFSNFWFWTWSYAREYGSINNLRDGWINLTITLPWAVRPFVLWEIVLFGLAAPLWSRYARQHRSGFVTCFFLFSVLAVCPCLYFRPHYFILLLPAAALCTGIAVESAQEELRRRKAGWLTALPPLYFAIVYIIALHGQLTTFFRLDPIALSRKIHYDQPYADAVTVADFIKARSNPSDEIGIVGSEPEICFYTHLRCASSYLYVFPLIEQQRFARQMQDDFMRELESTRPRFLIYEDDERAWGWKRTLGDNLAFFTQAWKFAHTDYELVGQVAANPNIGGYPDALWGDQAAFYIFQRKDQ
jgi:dolichyl-phosphate-mannose-protein mannosyltransferase